MRLSGWLGEHSLGLILEFHGRQVGYQPATSSHLGCGLTTTYQATQHKPLSTPIHDKTAHTLPIDNNWTINIGWYFFRNSNLQSLAAAKCDNLY